MANDSAGMSTTQKTVLGCGLGFFALVALIVFLVFNSASCQREVKTLRSDFGGGIERTVTVYDYDGEVIREWHGTFDIDENDQEVYFDLDGRRVIVQGGIVVIEEETAEEFEARTAARDGA